MRKLYIEQLLSTYIKNGCSKQTIEQIKTSIFDIIENIKDKTPEEIILPIIYELDKASRNFLDTKNNLDLNVIYGLSSSVYLNGVQDWKLLLFGGKTQFDGYCEIDENTPFDVASITKLYTLILKDKFVELGYIKNDDKFKDLLPEYGDLEDFTLEDISLLCGQLKTIDRIDSAKDQLEAYKILRTVYLSSNDKTRNLYTDLGAILTGIAITRRFNEINSSNLNFNEILNMFIFEKCGMESTTFNPSKDIVVAGNGNNENLVHDPKTRVLGGISGAAGLFTTPNDQTKLAEAIFNGNNSQYNPSENIVSPQNIRKYGTVTFPNSPQANKGHFGVYVKNDDPNKWFCPLDYSDTTFVHQGWTGPYTVFDPINKVNNSIFTAAIRPDLDKQFLVNDKPIGFSDGFHIYQDTITRNTLILKVIKEYLAKFYEDSSLEVKVKIRQF